VHRHLRLILAAALAACSGKTGPTGIEVTVQYTLVSPGDGCIRLEAIPEGGAGVFDDVELTGRSRTGEVTFGVAQGEGWPKKVELYATLHAGACSGPNVKFVSHQTSFPAQGVDALTIELRENAGDGGTAGGGAAGGSAGGGEAGGAAGGATAGGATAGGATAGGATAGGATAGGATAGGATAGGATAGGATAGGATAGGATAGGATAGGATAGGATAGGATAGGATAGGATAGGATAGGATAGGAASTFCTGAGLMGCWPMNEGGGMTVEDQSANSNDGTLSGPTWVQTDAGTALRFAAGADQMVNIPDHDSLSATNALTLEAWVRPSQAVGTDNTVDRIIDKGVNSEYMLGFGKQNPGIITVSLDNSDRDSNEQPTIGAWQHVGVTWTAGTQPILYRNGVAVETLSSVNGPLNNTNTPLAFGNSSTGANMSARFVGDMNRVRIWSVARSAQEMCRAAGRTWNMGMMSCN